MITPDDYPGSCLLHIRGARPTISARLLPGAPSSRNTLEEDSVVRFVSPSPIFDIARVFPELEPFAATTVRLHPRRGKPGARDSSVSGPLLWPADEPWPWCTAPHEHDSPNAYQPLLQVFAHQDRRLLALAGGAASPGRREPRPPRRG